MPFDGTGADEQVRADLGVRHSLPRESRDPLLLRRELVGYIVAGPADFLARGEQLDASAFGEGVRPHRGERAMGVTELFARVGPPSLAAQPFAVVEMGARQLDTDARPTEALDRLAV